MTKRFFTLYFLLLIMLTTVAQSSMSVVSFQLLDNDLTATIQGTAREDMNADKAALIKIPTVERGFNFTGDMLGLVATEEKPNAIWVYVPHRAHKLTIQHPRFGTFVYEYPITINKARTYEMMLDFGLGRYVTINAAMTGARVSIDGQDVGESPVVNRYVNYGQHTLTATKAPYYEGALTFDVFRGNEQEVMQVDVPMQDMSGHYGDVAVSVADDADIWFEGTKVGSGTWLTRLREGKYEVETRKVDCDSVLTVFEVIGGRQNNITAQPPMLHQGWLDIYTKTRDLQITPTRVGQTFDATRPIRLPIGHHIVDFSNKKRVSETREYDIRWNETTTDTITLKHRAAWSVGVGWNKKNFSSVEVRISALTDEKLEMDAIVRIKTGGNLTIDAPNQTSNGYDVVGWSGVGGYQATAAPDRTFSRDDVMDLSLLIMFGYHCQLAKGLALTPQVGFGSEVLSIDGNPSMGLLGAIGAKLSYSPVKFIQLYASAQYEAVLGMGKQDKLDDMTAFDFLKKYSSFKPSALSFSAGLAIVF